MQQRRPQCVRLAVSKTGRRDTYHLDSLLGGHGVGGFVDEVSSVQAQDVDSQDLAGVLAVDHLCHAIALLLCQCLWTAGEPHSTQRWLTFTRSTTFLALWLYLKNPVMAAM